MTTYVLVVAAGLDVSSAIIFPLIGKRYRNVPAMREAVEQTLGALKMVIGSSTLRITSAISGTLRL